MTLIVSTSKVFLKSETSRDFYHHKPKLISKVLRLVLLKSLILRSLTQETEQCRRNFNVYLLTVVLSLLQSQCLQSCMPFPSILLWCHRRPHQTSLVMTASSTVTNQILQTSKKLEAILQRNKNFSSTLSALKVRHSELMSNVESSLVISCFPLGLRILTRKLLRRKRFVD